MSLPTMSLGLMFCTSRNGGIGGAPEGCKQLGHLWAQL